MFTEWLQIAFCRWKYRLIFVFVNRNIDLFFNFIKLVSDFFFFGKEKVSQKEKLQGKRRSISSLLDLIPLRGGAPPLGTFGSFTLPHK